LEIIAVANDYLYQEYKVQKYSEWPE
jgi:hypothetical protein